MASNNKPQPTSGAPVTSPRGKKEQELQLKEAKARKKEAQKDLARAKEQLAQVNSSVSATEEEKARVEANLAVQERTLRERDRSLRYLNDLLTSSNSGRIGGNELLTSVFSKLARLGSGKKKKQKKQQKKKGSSGNGRASASSSPRAEAAGAHSGADGNDSDGDDDDDDEVAVDDEDSADSASRAEGRPSPAAAKSPAAETPRAGSGHASPPAASPGGERKLRQLLEEDDVPSGDHEQEEDEDEDDGGYFIFDLRSKVRCERRGTRNACVWAEFHQLCSNLRYFRDFKAREVADLFVLVSPPSEESVGKPGGLEGLMASIQQRTRAPLSLIERLFTQVDKLVGKHKTCTCVFIGLVSVGQAPTSLEKEALMFDAMTRGANGLLTLDGAKELFRYRFVFVQALVLASAAIGGAQDPKRVKKELKRLFGKHVHDQSEEKVWNRAAVAAFRFVELQRARERRTRIEGDDNGRGAPLHDSPMIVTQREWVHALKYLAHHFHEPAPQLFRGDGPDELIGDNEDEDDATPRETRQELSALRSKRSPRTGESGDSVENGETDNEEYYLSDYEIEDTQAAHPASSPRSRGQTPGGRRPADWTVNHTRELAAFIEGLNPFLRSARTSCRAVLSPLTLSASF